MVTGPGLPSGGITLTAQNLGSWFKITTANANACADFFMCGTNYWIMNDNEIGQVATALAAANNTYTVKLYDNAATPALLATYSNTITAAPVLNGSLATLSYPTLTAMANLTGMGATTLTPSWNVPAGLTPSMLWIYAWQQVTGAGVSIRQDINSATGTASLAITAPPNGGTWDGDTYSNYQIWATDQSARKVMSMYR